MSKYGLVLFVAFLAVHHQAAARVLPSDAGLNDQKNYMGFNGVGSYGGIGDNGIPYGGVFGGVGGGGGANGFNGIGGVIGTGPNGGSITGFNGIGGLGGLGGGVGAGGGGGAGGAGVFPHP